MCRWGDELIVPVLIPAHLSHNGRAHWANKGVDRCLADIVNALNKAGCYTETCCCGHGKTAGSVKLQDGRELVILNA